MIEERILALAIAHPGLGPRRVASELARPKWGGIVVSANGVWKVLRRHGLNTRSKRLALIAGYAAPYEPPRERSGGRDCRSAAKATPLRRRSSMPGSL